jgi:hypothetical protein
MPYNKHSNSELYHTEYIVLNVFTNWIVLHCLITFKKQTSLINFQNLWLNKSVKFYTSIFCLWKSFMSELYCTWQKNCPHFPFHSITFILFLPFTCYSISFHSILSLLHFISFPFHAISISFPIVQQTECRDMQST